VFLSVAQRFLGGDGALLGLKLRTLGVKGSLG